MEKRAPLSFTPRRFAIATKQMAMTVSRTLWPWRNGAADVMAEMPAETDTATVRM
jgi:hypothetical protein